MFWFAMIILTILAIPIFYVVIRAAVVQEKGTNEQKYAVFDFLVDQYEFRKGKVERLSAYAGGDCLSFDKQDLKIVIYHDYRGEIDGTFTLGEWEATYPLEAVLKLLG
ncbi:hypothetical protein C2W62_14280 [Candidatus Entotheonella serta]|nr:hypothetical protein C2W62_14280 [Candidatus Entotheonella serta]